jgi:sulfhydrogenase subunit delta
MKTTKPKVGLFGLTGCAGCELSVLFTEDILLELLDKINLVAAPFFKEDNKQKYDIALVSGVVVDKNDIKKLKEYRKNSKTLIALGACAIHGNVPALKNFMNKKVVEKAAYETTKHLESVKPSPISDYVKVDFSIPGCPPNSDEIVKYIKDILLGKKLVENKKSVCFECNLRENYCLLYQGKPCMGPLTRAGCSALCPSVGKECTGCRGPIEDANIDEVKKIFKDKGLDPDRILNKLNKYAGLKFKELMKKNEKKD